MHIHHTDGNPANNDIANLEMLSGSEHIRQHMIEHYADPANRAVQRDRMNDSREAINAGHRTTAARAAHSRASKAMWQERKTYALTCRDCGTSVETYFPDRSLICLPCRKEDEAERYTVERICVRCGKGFSVYKYAKTQNCSAKCAAQSRWARA